MCPSTRKLGSDRETTTRCKVRRLEWVFLWHFDSEYCGRFGSGCSTDSAGITTQDYTHPKMFRYSVFHTRWLVSPLHLRIIATH
jgi:hypothetical protein